MPVRKVSTLEKTVAAASAMFRDVCSEEPPYHTAEELWEGVKQGDEGARLLFLFSCFYAKMKECVAVSKKQLRQRERDGWSF